MVVTKLIVPHMGDDGPELVGHASANLEQAICMALATETRVSLSVHDARRILYALELIEREKGYEFPLTTDGVYPGDAL